MNLDMAGVALILCAVASVVNGTASVIGAWSREAMEPVLRRISDSSSLGRPELANATLMLAIGLAVYAMVIDRSLGGLLVAALITSTRPKMVARLRRQHPLESQAQTMMSDLVLGVYAPIVAANVLFGEIALASSLLAVMVSISWPAGGWGSTKLRVAPVPSA